MFPFQLQLRGLPNKDCFVLLCGLSVQSKK
jgi:hypothetical protein